MRQASILIVEDEAIVATDIEDTLSSLGYHVCGVVAKGEDVIKRVGELAPDLVLMDIKLKGQLDGIDVALELKKHHRVPVVYLTAHADEATLARAKITEPYGYVLKPFEEIELRIALELALYKHKLQPKTTGPALMSQHHPTDASFTEKHSIDRQALLKFLQGVAPFSSLPDEGLNFLASGSTSRKFAAGEILAFEGDSAANGFLVLSGRVSMVKTSASGRELIVELLPPGDTFGLISTFDNRPYSFTCRAQVASEVLFVPQALMVSLLDHYPDLYRKFIDVISDRLVRSHSFSRALAHDRVDVRIASALTALVPQFSNTSFQNTAQYNTTQNTATRNSQITKRSLSEKQGASISITRQELADFTGTTVETAIRATKAMERDGILDLREAGIIKILNQEELTAIAGEDTTGDAEV